MSPGHRRGSKHCFLDTAVELGGQARAVLDEVVKPNAGDVLAAGQPNGCGRVLQAGQASRLDKYMTLLLPEKVMLDKG